MRSEILRVEALKKSFGDEKVLQNVTFSVFEGETLAILGANGAGKTSLINILGCSIQMDSGRIYFRDKLIDLKTSQEARMLGIYVVGDNSRIVDSLTVAENVMLGRERRIWISNRRLKSDVIPFLEEVKLSVHPDTLAGTLSAEERSALQLAAILSSSPSLLIIDNPSCLFSGLEVAQVRKIIKSLNHRNTAVIFITQDIMDAMIVSNRIMILRDGIAIGIFDKENCTYDQLLSVMIGKRIPSTNPSNRVSLNKFLEIKDLSGNILRNINISIRKGEILGISGTSGAGKSELLDLIFGIKPNRSSSIRMDGEIIRNTNPSQAIKNRFAYAPEDNYKYGLVMTMSVRENLSLNAIRRVSQMGWICKRSERVFTETYLKLIQTAKIDQKRPVKNLSTGHQKIVQLLKCLASRPSVLLLDEPTKSIDVSSREYIKTIIRELSEQGMTIIIASSDVKELLTFCDRILVFHEGVITGEIDSQKTEQSADL